MKPFRWLFRVIVGFFCLVGLLVVAVVVLAIVGFRELPGSKVVEVPQRAVLYFNVADGVVETRPMNFLQRAASHQSVVLRDLVRALDAAAGDNRVQGVVFHVGSGDLGFAQAQEIRDAIIAFRKSGKFAIAFAETFGEGGSGNLHYYLATAFDEIWMQPSGEVQLTGVMLEQPFLRDTLDLVGVKARIDKREEYKSGADMFTAASMPAPVRQNLQRLVDSYTAQLAAGIAEGRGLSAEEARALIDKGPFIAIEAQQQRLVNRLAYWDEVKTAAQDRANTDKSLSLADYIGALPEPPTDAPKIAVVYGVGQVELATTDDDDSFGGAKMGSHAIAQAIADAANDKDVKAIIFRIDSPGGSYVASDTIWREVDRARKEGKPVIVSMGDVAASGGYFVAAAAKSIVAQPGTITGSIGVFGGKFVVQGLWDKIGLHWDSVQGGRHADFESPNHDYSDEEWASLQASLDRIYFDFTHKVAEGRSLSVDKVLEEAKGQVWSGADAQANGLVDQLGGFQVALALARAEGGLAKDAPVRLVDYPKQGNDLDKLLGLLSQMGVDSQTLQSLAASSRAARLEAALERLLGPAAATQSGAQLRAPELEVR